MTGEFSKYLLTGISATYGTISRSVDLIYLSKKTKTFMDSANIFSLDLLFEENIEIPFMYRAFEFRLGWRKARWIADNLVRENVDSELCWKLFVQGFEDVQGFKVLQGWKTTLRWWKLLEI